MICSCFLVLVLIIILLLGDSTDDEDDGASDNCEFFDAQGSDSFDVTTNTCLVNRQSPNIQAQVFIFNIIKIVLHVNIKNNKNLYFRL